jgi:hypothetical protein
MEIAIILSYLPSAASVRCPAGVRGRLFHCTLEIVPASRKITEPNAQNTARSSRSCAPACSTISVPSTRRSRRLALLPLLIFSRASRRPEFRSADDWRPTPDDRSHPQDRGAADAFHDSPGSVVAHCGKGCDFGKRQRSDCGTPPRQTKVERGSTCEY